MKFKYTALSPNNQKIEGVLTAALREGAQEELHKMGFSIIALNEISEEDYTQEQQKKGETQKTAGVLTFFFRATDREKKTIEGTIEAPLDEMAYRRLITDYHLKVETFYPLEATETEKTAMAQKQLEWNALLEREGITSKAREEEKESLDPAFLAEIDKVIEKSKEVLRDHRSFFKTETLHLLEERLGDLQRIRTSNNLRHIAEVSSHLLELIRNPNGTSFLDAQNTAFQKTLNELQDNMLFKEDLRNYEKKIKLTGLRSTLDQLKKKLGFFSQKKLITAPSKPSKLTEWFKAHFKKKSSASPSSDLVRKSPSLSTVVQTLYRYLKASNEITQNIQKHELLETWKEYKETLKKKRSTLSPFAPAAKASSLSPAPSRDFAWIFLEMDSFIAWLLAFYLFYFLMVSFSLEKQIGIPVQWVARTLQSPLLVNLALILFFSHVLLTIKIKGFHQNFGGSLFLFGFGYGILTLLLFNF